MEVNNYRPRVGGRQGRSQTRIKEEVQRGSRLANPKAMEGKGRANATLRQRCCACVGRHGGPGSKPMLKAWAAAERHDNDKGTARVLGRAASREARGGTSGRAVAKVVGRGAQAHCNAQGARLGFHHALQAPCPNMALGSAMREPTRLASRKPREPRQLLEVYRCANDPLFRPPHE